jgi:predicted  nucleic acid-binding Zn-ribbon protein
MTDERSVEEIVEECRLAYEDECKGSAYMHANDRAGHNKCCEDSFSRIVTNALRIERTRAEAAEAEVEKWKKRFEDHRDATIDGDCQLCDYEWFQAKITELKAEVEIQDKQREKLVTLHLEEEGKLKDEIVRLKEENGLLKAILEDTKGRLKESLRWIDNE